MGKLVEPKVYFIGETGILQDGMKQYLLDTGNSEFINTMEEAKKTGLSDGEILCSFYAKLCYRSLTLGHNSNVSRIRDIPDNLRNCFDQGHGSVFEHCFLNFVITDCSRVFTHELVRHRVGVAYSQTSGRYCRGDEFDIVFDPILNPIKDKIEEVQKLLEDKYKEMVNFFDLDNMKEFSKKKKITSALRRILPNGQSNEIGFGVNLRSIRHLVQIRTGRHAEWEIRHVFGQIYNLVKSRYPLLFYGAQEEMVDGLLEVSGMRMQPYENSGTT